MKWEELEIFMRIHCPELFYTEMSPMYNNPELRQGGPDDAQSDQAGGSRSQRGRTGDDEAPAEGAEAEAAVSAGGVLAALLPPR